MCLVSGHSWQWLNGSCKGALHTLAVSASQPEGSTEKACSWDNGGCLKVLQIWPGSGQEYMEGHVRSLARHPITVF